MSREPTRPAGAPPPLALIYTRVSGPGQEEDGASLETQEADCRALAARLGFAVGRVSREVFRGTELFNRPLLTQDRADLRAGRFTALLVWHPDRLARNPIHQAIVIEEAIHAGARVEFVHEPLDMSREGQLIAYVKGYAASIERERIRARSLSGKLTRVRSGKLTRSGVDLYGYQRDHDAGVRLAYAPESEVVLRIFELCAHERMGVWSIAQLLNEEGVPAPSVGKVRYRDGHVAIWRPRAVLIILRNPAYRGVTVAWRLRSVPVPPDPAHPRRWQYHSQPRPEDEHIPLPDGVTPAIVSEELWDAAQEVLNSRAANVATRQRRDVAHGRWPYLLRGRLQCATCERPMYPLAIHHGRNLRYYCSSKHEPCGPCGGSLIPAPEIDEWVWSEVTKLLADPDLIRRELAGANATYGHNGRSGSGASGGDDGASERERVTQEVARCERQQARMLARYNAVDDERVLPWSTVEAEIARLEGAKRRAVERLAVINRMETQQATARAQQEAIRRRLQLAVDLRGDYANAPAPERHAALDALSVRVSGNGQRWRMTAYLWPLTTALTTSDAQVPGDAPATPSGATLIRDHEPPPPRITRRMRREAARAAREASAASEASEASNIREA